MATDLRFIVPTAGSDVIVYVRPEVGAAALAGAQPTVLRQSQGTWDIDADYTDAFTANSPGTTYWVSTTGSNSNNGLSKVNAFADIQHAISQMIGGDECIVGDGTYSNNFDMLINEETSSGNPTQSIPNGSAGAYTVIRAETPFGVRIEMTNNTDYYGHYVGITSNYIWVDGFVFVDDSSSYPEQTTEVSGNFNRITRCIIKRRQMSTYGTNWSCHGDDNLYQDCASVGAGRYGFIAGPGNCKRNLFRRCVARIDFNNTNEPKANFMIYSDSGTQDNVMENCIGIDTNETSVGDSATYDQTFSTFYIRAGSTRTQHYGCLAVGNDFGSGGEADYGVFYWERNAIGEFIGEDIVVWGNNLGANEIIGFNDENSAGQHAPDRFTIGQNGGTDFTSQQFQVNANPPPNSYISNTAPTNILNEPTGAQVKFAVGAFLSHFGDTGYNTVTTDRLWPYPYEDEIRTVFSEQMNTPSGYEPAGNDSTRGFCAPGVASLTEYLHEYTGTPIDLDDFYS